jgi:restriction system protein
VGVLRLDQKLMSVRVCFQCKKYKGSVSAHDVRDFRGALSTRGGDRGLFLTTGTFTHEAKAEAAKAPAIDLIDGDRLCGLLKQHELGVKILVDRQWLGSI